MLDVPRLRVFREIARHGSLRGAADALSYTPSAVSQQLAALEREVGATLVVRGPKGIWLTDAGRAFARHSEAILRRLTEAQSELDAINGLRGGVVRLAAFPTANSALLPDVVATFRELYPDVQIELREMMPSAALTALRRGEVDVALIFESEAAARESDITTTLILEDPLLVALPSEDRRTRRKVVPLAELADDDWVHGDESCPCYPLVMHACGEAGFVPHASFTSNDYAAIQGLVAAGVGVGLIPLLSLTSIRDGVAVRSARPAPIRHIVAASLETDYEVPATQAMLEVLLDCGKRLANRLEGLL